MESITDDLLIGILLNLPVKSLVRFRSVSKHFYNLITSHDFIDRHLNHEKQETIFVKWCSLVQDNGISVLSSHSDQSLCMDVKSEMEYPFYFTDGEELVGSDTNGLVSITSCANGIYLCNLALREFKLIPRMPFRPLEGGIYPAYISGFGFDPKTKGYKVVLVYFYFEDGCPSYDYEPCSKVALYDIKNNSWREIDDFVVPFPSRTIGWQLSFNGVCHWLSVKDDDQDFMHILCFNLSSETFGLMEFPDECSARYCQLQALLVLHESLALLHSEHPEDGGRSELVDIWVMKEHGLKESWVKLYVIGPLPIERPLTFLKDGRLLIVCTSGRLALYTPETNEILELDVSGVPYAFTAVAFKESLVSVASLFNNPN